MELLYHVLVDRRVHDEGEVMLIKLDVISKPEEECSICIEPCDKCVELQCGHYFHIECINSWMEEQKPAATCPNCRAQVV
jgi:E3 ubiquitin-protein ligase synoviolin